MSEVFRLMAVRARSGEAGPAFLTAADGRALSWQDLARYAGALRELAAHRQLPDRARIGISSADPLAFTAAYLGILAADLTAVPIDPRLTQAEIGATADRLRLDVLLAGDPAVQPWLPDTDLWDIGSVKPLLVRSSASGNWPGQGAAMRPAVLLTSSGTTGRPKGIGLSQWQLLHAARRVAHHHRFGPGERGYSPLPLFHVNAQVMGLLATLVSGGSLVLDRRFDPHTYWERVAQWQPTWLNTVPAVLAALATEAPPPEAVAARIRFARSASAPLPTATQRAFTGATGVPVLETYGMTEAAGQITANPLDARARRVGTVGVPVGLCLEVLDEGGRPARPGEPGMVALRGRAVAHRYLEIGDDGRERSRSARDAAGWLRTGDLGSRDDDGFLRLHGRTDDVINRGGEKIFPLEVENVLLAHPAVRSAAVVAAPHDRLGQVPVALVTLHRGYDTEEAVEALHDWCAYGLARYKRPTGISVADALPTGPTGKILRRRVREAL
ncbi:acyl--CoA ligase [Winogradskya consettensis]|uniref:AMP-dependent ligase n=1 Tax=Winogradskya consettensis TaxID=113560 RepID=A0A919SGP1_9ACTN|nr:AMP-binding protein [Actinoplanes consettensis]GIM70353.1 AMP-dependent ligase [Actinoplanes consettensis]